LDKFDNIMKTTSQIPEKEHIKAINENKKLCICPTCPTYNECAENNMEALYCTEGKSAVCITKESGCICPACPVTEKLGLEKDYFCTKGTETKQRRKA
jgi:hypothetical protein